GEESARLTGAVPSTGIWPRSFAMYRAIGLLHRVTGFISAVGLRVLDNECRELACGQRPCSNGVAHAEVTLIVAARKANARNFSTGGQRCQSLGTGGVMHCGTGH